ncbi:MAG: 6-phosphogluconolactonase [Acidimicrobiales bacterium]
MTTGPDLRPVADVPGAFTSVILDAFRNRTGERFVMFLSGGPTARACYERLASIEPGSIDWSVVDVYMGDERIVPADDPDANQRLVREALAEPVGGLGSFTPMPTDGDPGACAARYAGTVSEVLDGPGVDVVHLGMGPDGHTASLFPGTPSLDVGLDTLVVATVDPNGGNAHRRLSLTLPAISRARLVVFTVVGSAKRKAVALLRSGADIPAARVRASDVHWLVDAEALGLDGAAT